MFKNYCLKYQRNYLIMIYGTRQTEQQYSHVYIMWIYISSVSACQRRWEPSKGLVSQVRTVWAKFGNSGLEREPDNKSERARVWAREICHKISFWLEPHSLLLSLALYGSLWLALRLSLALNCSLSLAIVGSLWSYLALTVSLGLSLALISSYQLLSGTCSDC